MPTAIERIRDLKTAAKNQRDRGTKKGLQRAEQMLREAIAIAGRDLTAGSAGEQASLMAAETSDCLGLVGGIERRLAEQAQGDERVQHLKAAIAAYDEGFVYESGPDYGIVNSYNLVNRLVVRLLLRPHLLASDSAEVSDSHGKPSSFADALDQAAGTIRKQLAGPRHGDCWALADLALIEVLSGRSSADRAYANFLGLPAPDFALASALASLRPLAALPLPSAAELSQAAALLEARLQQLRT